MKRVIALLCSIAAMTSYVYPHEPNPVDSCAMSTIKKWDRIISKLPRLSGYMQTGWNYNSLGSGTSTFQIKRLRLLLDGTINDRASFRLQVEALSGLPAHHNGQKSIQVIDAYATYKVCDALSVRAGQFNSPLCYENYNLSPATMETIDFSSLSSRVVFRNAIGYDYSDFGRDLGIMVMGDLFPTGKGYTRLSYNVSLTNGHLPSIDDNNKSKEVQGVIFYRPGRFLNIKAGYNFGEFTGEKNPEGHKYQPMHRGVAGIWYDNPTGIDLRGEYGICNARHNGRDIVKENTFYILAAWHLGKFLPVIRYDYCRDSVEKATLAGNFDKYLVGLNYVLCKNIKLRTNYTLTAYTNSSRASNGGHRTSNQVQIMGEFSF